MEEYTPKYTKVGRLGRPYQYVIQEIHTRHNRHIWQLVTSMLKAQFDVIGAVSVRTFDISKYKLYFAVLIFFAISHFIPLWS